MLEQSAMRRTWVLFTIAMTLGVAANAAPPESPATAAAPTWNQALEWARSAPVRAAVRTAFDLDQYFGPMTGLDWQAGLRRADAWGWPLRSIVQRGTHVRGEAADRSRTAYRGRPVLRYDYQLALLRMRDPAATVAELVSRIRHEEFQFRSNDIRLDLRDELQRTFAPLVDIDPADMICLDSDYDEVSYRDGTRPRIVRLTTSCGTPPAISNLLQSWSIEMHHRWTQQEAGRGFAVLVDGLDRPAERSEWFVAACHEGEAALAAALLGRGFPARMASPSGGLPLVAAAAAGSTELMQRLLTAGADPNACDGDGMCPIVAAVGSGSRAAVNFLLTRGARPDPSRNGEPVPSVLMAARESLDLGLYMLEKGAREDAWMFLEACAAAGRADAIKRVLALAGPFDGKDFESAIAAAEEHGYLEVADLLRAEKKRVAK